MVYSQQNITKAIFTSVKRCNTISPCYLLHTRDSTERKNNTKIKQYSYNDNELLFVSKLTEGEAFKDIISFELESSIRDNQIIALVDYDPASLYMPPTHGTEFISGVYNWEKGSGSFIWASGNVKMKLNNSQNKRSLYELSLGLGTLMPRDVVFTLNGQQIKKVHVPLGIQSTSIVLLLDLPQGDSILEITTNVPTAKPIGTLDSRKMTFSMSNMVYGMLLNKK